MGNSRKIDEIIDTAATTGQYKTMADQIDSLQAKFVALTKEVNSFNAAAKQAKGFADFNKNAAAAALSAEKLLQVQNQTAISAAKLAEQEAKLAATLEKQQAVRDKNAAKQSQQTAKDIADSQKRTAQNDKEAQANAAALLKSAQNVDKSRRPYNQLNADLERMRLNARDVGAIFGVQSKAFKDASYEVRELDKQLKTIDGKLGQNQRNVGDYAGGFSKAFGFIRQAAYILPGLGVAGIFNKLGEGVGIFIDAVKGGESTLTLNRTILEKTNDAYATQIANVKVLTAETQSANTTSERRGEIIEELNRISPTYFGNIKTEQDLVDKLPGAYAKYNTALQLTARIKAAQDLIGEKYKDQLAAELKLAQVRAKEANDKGYLGYLEQFATTLQNITSLTATGNDTKTIGEKLFGKIEEAKIAGLGKNIQQLTNIAVKARQDLDKNGGDIAGKTIEDQERVANNFTEVNKIKLQVAIDFNKDIVADDKKSYAARQQALVNATALEKQLLGLSLNQQLNDITLMNDKKAVIQEQYNTDINKLNIDQEKQARDLRTKAAKDDLDFQNQRLERQKKLAENKTLDPKSDYQDRIDALEAYRKASESIIKNTEQIALKDAGENAIKIKTIREKARNDLLDVDNDADKKGIQMREDAQNRIVKLLREGVKNQEDILLNSQNVFLQYGEQQSEAIQQNAEDALLSLNKQYADQLIGQDEFNRQKFDIEHESAQDTIRTQIAVQTSILALQKEFEADTTATEKKISDLKIKLSKDTTEQQIGDQEKIRQKRIKDAEEALQIVQAIQDFTKAAVDGAFANELDRLQKRSDAVSTQADIDKANIENSLLSSQQKAQQEKIIDAQALADKKAIQDQENIIKNKQAEFDRALTIAGIIENTALAVVKVIGEAGIFGIPLTSIVAGIGALQLATVLATPLPKYAKGTDNHPGGPGIVGDAGFELIQYPNGHTFLSDSKPTVLDMPAGTTVVPHLETLKTLQKINYTGGQQMDMREVAALLKENNKYQRKIADKPTGGNKNLVNDLIIAQSRIDRRNSYFK